MINSCHRLLDLVYINTEDSRQGMIALVIFCYIEALDNIQSDKLLPWGLVVRRLLVLDKLLSTE